MTPEMRALATYIATQYATSTTEMIIMSAPVSDPATLVDFEKINQWASRQFACKACGSRYTAVTNTTFCVDCLSTLYIPPRGK